MSGVTGIGGEGRAWQAIRPPEPDNHGHAGAILSPADTRKARCTVHDNRTQHTPSHGLLDADNEAGGGCFDLTTAIPPCTIGS